MNQSTEGYGFLHDSQKAHYQPNQFSANSQHSTTAAECSNQDGSQHLPKFLFGSLESPLVHKKSFAGPSRAKVSVGSPSILKTRDSNSTNTPSPGQKSVHWSPLLVKERLKSPESIQRKVITHLPSPWSGPPLRSITMQDDGPPCKQSRADSSLDPLQTSEFIKQGSSITNAHDSIQISDFTNNSHISEEITIYWVTIFGFPPEKCKGILELFSRHGDIVSKKIPTNKNWVHVRYSSTVHARQALSKNAMLFDGYMIGVIPCKDTEIVDDNVSHASEEPLMSKSLNGSNRNLCTGGERMIPSVSIGRSSSLYLPGRSRLSMSARTGMRPLNASSQEYSNGLNNTSLLNQSSNASMQNGADDSFLGKIWNMFSNN